MDEGGDISWSLCKQNMHKQVKLEAFEAAKLRQNLFLFVDVRQHNIHRNR